MCCRVSQFNSRKVLPKGYSRSSASPPVNANAAPTPGDPLSAFRIWTAPRSEDNAVISSFTGSRTGGARCVHKPDVENRCLCQWIVHEVAQFKPKGGDRIADRGRFVGGANRSIGDGKFANPATSIRGRVIPKNKSSTKPSKYQAKS